jgi:hypothetical protein
MGRAPWACHSPKARALSDKTLIVFLHGIGASGAQLMPLASSWRASLPNTSFVAPDAPMHHRYGLQWFSTEGNPLDPERIESAREAFDGLVKDVVRREGFADAHDRIAFAASRKAPSSRSTPLPPGGGRSAPSWRSPACFPHSWFRPSHGLAARGCAARNSWLQSRAGCRAGHRTHGFQRRRPKSVVFSEEDPALDETRPRADRSSSVTADHQKQHETDRPPHETVSLHSTE